MLCYYAREKANFLWTILTLFAELGILSTLFCYLCKRGGLQCTSLRGWILK